MASFDQAIQQMLADGMPPFPDGVPRLDTGRVVRYGPKRKAWYRLFEFQARNGNRYISGAYGIWGGIESTKIRSDFEGMSDDERQRLQRSMAELEARERAKRAKLASFASNRAKQQWAAAKSTLPDGVECEYLKRKGVAPEKGLRFFADGTLLVPMIRYDVSEESEQDPDYDGPRRMVGVQKIAPDGTKCFNKNMAKEGAMCRLGSAKDGDVLLVTEGLATALTIRQATGMDHAVFVAFDAYNLRPAARILRALFPKSPIVFCADDDWKTEGNPGVTWASRAAGEIGLSCAIVPTFPATRGDKDTDFNDLAAVDCLQAVTGQIDPVIVTMAKAPRTAKKGSRDKSEQGTSGGGDSEPPPPNDAPPGCHFDGPFDPEGMPIIQVRAGELPATVDAAENALLDSDVKIYQRDRMLVRVMRRTVPSVRNYKRPAGSLGIVPVELAHLVESLTRVARWERFDPRSKSKDQDDEKGKWIRINAPDKVAGTYMARAGHWKLPELWSVVTAPTLRPDGTILQQPGYDEAMKAWYDPCGIEFPRIPEEPTQAEARAALATLKKAFSTFPFVDGVDQSVALSLALCGLVRRSLTSAPLGAITAPVMGSGKTLLADVISILATGSAAPTMTYSDNEEEFKKTLLAVLMEGDPVVLMDNVSHPLQGDTLCSILTSETYSQRMLGRTEMVKVQTTTQILANGNQLVLAGDLRTRALLTRLDAQTEHPEEREFKTELRNWFMEHRPRLVAAGLTVMRAWVVARGKKNGTAAVVKPFGRFEHWSDMVRSPLVWLGEPDPCLSVKELEKDDPHRAELRQVLHAWQKVFKTDCKKSSDVCRMLDQLGNGGGTDAELSLEEALRDVGRDRDGKWAPRRLSAWLKRHADRRVDNLVLVKADEKDHVQLWRVDEVPA
jgi:phage/plasmid primase-like uncharacterized protein